MMSLLFDNAVILHVVYYPGLPDSMTQGAKFLTDKRQDHIGIPKRVSLGLGCLSSFLYAFIGTPQCQLYRHFHKEYAEGY